MSLFNILISYCTFYFSPFNMFGYRFIATSFKNSWGAYMICSSVNKILTSPFILLFLLIIFQNSFSVLRASVLDVLNVLNAKYLAHLVYQTPKTPFIRCSKSYKICNMLQYPHKFATIQTYVAYAFIIIFLFIFLSHLSVNLTLKPQSSTLSHPNPLSL